MNKYLRHIKNLCRRHSITLVTGRDYDVYIEENSKNFSHVLSEEKYASDTFAVIATRLVGIPSINTKETYFNALHEIGHIVCDETECGQFDAAHRLQKVTRYILSTERAASMFAIKTNKFATTAYFDRLAAWNQYHYIESYESDWKTTFKRRHKYMRFGKENITI